MLQSLQMLQNFQCCKYCRDLKIVANVAVLKRCGNLCRSESFEKGCQDAAKTFKNVANVADLQSAANVAELSEMLQMLGSSQNVAETSRRFRAVALVLRTDQDNLQSLMPLKHMPFLPLMLHWPSEVAFSYAM